MFTCRVDIEFFHFWAAQDESRMDFFDKMIFLPETSDTHRIDKNTFYALDPLDDNLKGWAYKMGYKPI